MAGTISNIFLCQPAVRMMVVVVGVEIDGETGQSFVREPVLYEVVVLRHEADRDSWRVDPLICVGRKGILSPDLAFDPLRTAWQSVVCPWDRTEDEAELAPLFERLTDRASKLIVEFKKR